MLFGPVHRTVYTATGLCGSPNADLNIVIVSTDIIVSESGRTVPKLWACF